jgi:hypothetical protein
VTVQKRRDDKRRTFTFEHRLELTHGPVVDPPRPSLFADEAEMLDAYEHFRDRLIDVLAMKPYRRFGRPAPWAVVHFEPELLEDYPRDVDQRQVGEPARSQ